MSALVGLAFLARAWRQVRRERRELRLLRHIVKYHDHDATLEETIATFWLGSMYARHGTDEQLDRWYEIVHGPVGDDLERLAVLEERYT